MYAFPRERTQGYLCLSICISHLSAVTLFYGTVTFVYVIPKSGHSSDHIKVVSVFYTVVIPMLNPLIYSLRNRGERGHEKIDG